MDLCYVLLKCAGKSSKGIDQLKLLKKLPDKFNLEEYIKEHNIGNAFDRPAPHPKMDISELLKLPEDPILERIRRYSKLKERLLQQILPFCICTEYYEQESNNKLSKEYFECFLDATDTALSKQLCELEKVFKQNNCNYDIVLATALAIRYGIEKGFLKVEE